MGHRILLVDNEVSFRQLARQLLTSSGHVIVGEAGSMQEAMDQATALRPDAVLADIGLPDGDGLSLTVRLLALPSPPRVVLTSADDDVVNTRQALNAGAVGFVPKAELFGTKLQVLLTATD